MQRQFDRELLAIRAHRLQLDPPLAYDLPLSASLHTFHAGPMRRAQMRRHDQIANRAPPGLIRRIAEYRFGSGVEHDHVTFGIDHDDPVQRGGQNRVHPFIRLPQRLAAAGGAPVDHQKIGADRAQGQKQGPRQNRQSQQVCRRLGALLV